MTDIPRKVGVVGLGVMGFDIAFLYAMKGFQTVVYDASKAVMNSLSDRREQTIDRLKKRNRISDAETENVRNLLRRSRPTTFPASFPTVSSWPTPSWRFACWNAGRASTPSIKLPKNSSFFRP